VRFVSQTWFCFLQKSFVGSEDGGDGGESRLTQTSSSPMTLRHWERARPLRNTFVEGCRSIKAVQCKPQAPFVVRKPEAHRGRRRTRLCLLYFRWHGTRYRNRGHAIRRKGQHGTAVFDDLCKTAAQIAGTPDPRSVLLSATRFLSATRGFVGCILRAPIRFEYRECDAR